MSITIAIRKSQFVKFRETKEWLENEFRELSDYDVPSKKDIEKIGEGSYACVLIGDKIMKDLNKQKKIENLYQIKFADNKLYTQDINPKVEKNLIYYGSADGLSKIYSSLSYKEFNSNIFNDRNGEGSISSIHIERAVL